MTHVLAVRFCGRGDALIGSFGSFTSSLLLPGAYEPRRWQDVTYKQRVSGFRYEAMHQLSHAKGDN